jgi:hypothetical protein
MSEVPKIEYSERLVAFLDVMGFKELLNRGDSIQKLQKFYKNVFETLDAKARIYTDSYGSPADDFKKLIVSDAVVISVKLPSDPSEQLKCCARFFTAISYLQSLMAFDDIWMRGAISLGDLFIDESKNVLVGPAFVQAYNLEKLADYPRVVIDPQLCGRLGYTPHEFVESIKRDYQSCGIMNVKEHIRLDGPIFSVNALQLDWFMNAFTTHKDLTVFFNGFKSRMVKDQVLFEKCLKLGKYLRESYCVETVDRKTDRGLTQKNIDSFLNSLGF